MRVAVIDMGTNTFNLLVAEVGNAGFATVYHHNIGVLLGQGGINSGTIGPQAYERGLMAIDEHCARIKELGVDKVKAFATSAIRSASNGGAFVDEIARRHGIDVEIISGDREAELIYKGVAASVVLGSQRVLIMDIGGGSNELIICDGTGILWKQSFPLGMSRLLEQHTPSDPIASAEVEAVERYLTEGMQPLWEACSTYHPEILIGASGAFDTFRAATCCGSDTDATSCDIDMKRYDELHAMLLSYTLAQRRLIPGMDELRVLMIVLASIATTLVLRKTDIGTLMQSSYSLKEGAVAELLGFAVKN